MVQAASSSKWAAPRSWVCAVRARPLRLFIHLCVRVCARFHLRAAAAEATDRTPMADEEEDAAAASSAVVLADVPIDASIFLDDAGLSEDDDEEWVDDDEDDDDDDEDDDDEE